MTETESTGGQHWLAQASATTRAQVLHGVRSGKFTEVVGTLKGMSVAELRDFERDLETAASLVGIVRRRRDHDQWRARLHEARPHREEQT